MPTGYREFKVEVSEPTEQADAHPNSLSAPGDPAAASASAESVRVTVRSMRWVVLAAAPGPQFRPPGWVC